MKVFVTGVGGQLGYDVACEALKRGLSVVGSDATEAAPEAFAMLVEDYDACNYVSLDITDKNAVLAAVNDASPDLIVHCAAWTAVDAAEELGNYKKVYSVNVEGTKNIVHACDAVEAKMVYISTDYVFDGTGTEPWKPDYDDYRPINIYGETKLGGEFVVTELLKKFFIVRIAWVFGKNGNNFVKTMLKVGKTHDTLRVVNDQIGTPTYTFDLARLLVDMIESEKYGYYHATNEGGYISWYDFACEIFRQAALKWPEAGYDRVFVEPVTTEEYGLSAAARPFNSRLDKSKLDDAGFERLPTWQDALARYLDELNPAEL